jgi:hypothetical protein
MMPTELVTGTVAVFADAGAQSFDLSDECRLIEIREIFIHVVSSLRLWSSSGGESISMGSNG